jgi:hypothetical protein
MPTASGTALVARLTPSPSETRLDDAELVAAGLDKTGFDEAGREARTAGSLLNSGSATSTDADEDEPEKRGFSAAGDAAALGSVDRPFDFGVFPLE